MSRRFAPDRHFFWLTGLLLVCQVVPGCDKPAEKKSKQAVAVAQPAPPDEPPPAAAYVPHPPGTLTFNADIAPIVFNKCAACHHAGEIGPFPLLTYEDVKKRSSQIVEVTQKRVMPPWSAVRGYCDFQQDRSLTTDEMGMIAQWTDEGMPEGRPSDLPPQPEFASGWKFGEPDLVVRMSEPYTLPADVKDTNRSFVVHVPIDELKYVKGWDFNPGNTAIVHHAFVCVDPSGWARHLDKMDALPGFDGTLMDGFGSPDGFNLVWLPGITLATPDDNLSWPLAPGTDLVFELHLCGTGKAETVQASIGLYFATKPPTKNPGVVALIANTIDIPPGEKAYAVHDEYVLPVDAKLVSVGPHAHFRGKDVQAWAILPDGSESWLLRIKDWDFNWQNVYTYAEPLRLPKGTTLCMNLTYDNSPENPRNPTIPPIRVRQGRKSSDEMGEVVFSLLLDNERDAGILRQDLGRKMLRNNLERDFFFIRCDPNNSEAHYNLGTNFKSLGDMQRAAQHLEASIRINPNESRAHNNLASVYLELGRMDNAITQYSEAIRIYPNDAKAQFNLGHVYLLQGSLDQAATQFQAALDINKDFLQAEHNLGVISLKKKDFSAAEAHFERALRLNPGFEPARRALNSVSQKRGEHSKNDGQDAEGDKPLDD